MKKLILSASALAFLAGMLLPGSTAWSQNRPAKPAGDAAAAAPDDTQPHRVGLIDMAHIFKEYKKFNFLREDLKKDIAQSENQAKEMAERLNNLQKELKDLKEGKPGFAEKEAEFSTAKAEFETFRRQTQRDILKAESQIYHTIYMEVAGAVRRYSNYYKYTLVLRFNREELNPEDPKGLIDGMNRQVIYYREDDDITDSILQHLNDQFEKGQGGKSTAKPAAEPANTRKATRPTNSKPQ